MIFLTLLYEIGAICAFKTARLPKICLLETVSASAAALTQRHRESLIEFIALT